MTKQELLWMEYMPYRPSGYTDDLGIIADRNQWISAQQDGWHAMMREDVIDEAVAWCDGNGIKYLHDGSGRLIIRDRNGAALFKLRWS